MHKNDEASSDKFSGGGQQRGRSRGVASGRAGRAEHD